jgi:organic hydroperoxide reductase OsmC/OhrA
MGMKIRATVSNERDRNHVTLHTDERVHSIHIPSKAGGLGSSANGGELLFLALATCYCNDLYREAGSRGIEIAGVEVEVEGEFPAAGEPARNIVYRAKIKALHANQEQVTELMKHTDRVAEVHNTLRTGLDVRLVGATIEIIE